MHFIKSYFCILIKIVIESVLKGLMNNKSALVQVMAWRQIGDMPLTWTNADLVPWHIYTYITMTSMS